MGVKPPLGSQLDPSHPLSRGILGAWIFNEAGGNVANDLTRTTPAFQLATGGALKWSSWPCGLNYGSVTTGPVASRITARYPTLEIGAAAEITYVVCGTDLRTGTYGALGAVSSNSGPLVVDWNGTQYTYITRDSAANADTLPLTIGRIGATPKQLAFTLAQRVKVAYVDGVVNATSTPTAAGLTPAVTTGLYLYGNGGGTSSWGSIWYAYLWGRALSQAEIQRLTFDPYAMVAPPTRRLWSIPASANWSAAIPRGAATATGYAPTVLAGNSISVPIPKGTAVTVGKVPAVVATANGTRAIPKGTASTAGYVPTVTATANKLLPIPKGAASTVGYAPTVTATANGTRVIPQGAASTVGYAPTVLLGNSRAVAIPKGTAATTGYSPAVVATASRVIAVPKGAASTTGYAPTILTGNSVSVAIPKGAATSAGYVPTILATANRSVAIPKSAVVTAGYVPSVVASGGRLIAVPKGAAVTTGRVPVISYSAHQWIPIPKGAAALLGRLPYAVIAPPFTYDPTRAAIVLPEPRAYVVPAEYRVLVLPESRAYVVPAEYRVLVVPFEGRSYKVS